MLVDGDAKEIIPGIHVYTGGKHTFASQFATVNIGSGTVVLASDNMYLYENLASHVPIAQTLDCGVELANADANDDARLGSATHRAGSRPGRCSCVSVARQWRRAHSLTLGGQIRSASFDGVARSAFCHRRWAAVALWRLVAARG